MNYILFDISGYNYAMQLNKVRKVDNYTESAEQRVFLKKSSRPTHILELNNNKFIGCDNIQSIQENSIRNILRYDDFLKGILDEKSCRGFLFFKSKPYMVISGDN